MSLQPGFARREEMRKEEGKKKSIIMIIELLFAVAASVVVVVVVFIPLSLFLSSCLGGFCFYSGPQLVLTTHLLADCAITPLVLSSLSQHHLRLNQIACISSLVLGFDTESCSRRKLLEY